MLFIDHLTDEQNRNFHSAMQISAAFVDDPTRLNGVAQYSLILFDGLKKLHEYGQVQRFWLLMAAILHDIGRIEGHEDHHKSSLNFILNNSLIDLSNKERLIIGSIARYHRKSLPSLEHDHFAVLEKDEQIMVIKLASLLRLADGLEHLGDQKIRHLGVNYKKNKLILNCKTISDHSLYATTLPKSDLFELVFKLPVEIKWCSLL